MNEKGRINKEATNKLKKEIIKNKKIVSPKRGKRN
jgi:hypothetical protein